MSWNDQLAQWLNPATLAPLAAGLLRFFVIVIAAAMATKLVARLAPRAQTWMLTVMRQRSESGRRLELDKRARTVSGILQRTAVALIWAVALIMALREVGFDVAPILAGAGVVGLAVGFGAQNLVRDVITGLFMLIENQIRVGDVAVVNGTGGLVEEMNLRTTVLRGLDGAVHIFPNGKIDTISNMTRDFAYYVFDIGVSYGQDTDHAVGVLRRIADEMRQESSYSEAILEPLDVLGVDRFGDSSVVVKTRIKTLPAEQWRVGREMNRRIKKRFEEEGIEIPFPQRTLHLDASGRDLAAMLLSQDGGHQNRTPSRKSP